MKFCALVLMHTGRKHTEVKLLCGYQGDVRDVHLNGFTCYIKSRNNKHKGFVCDVLKDVVM